jgi:hypothetical protein
MSGKPSSAAHGSGRFVARRRHRRRRALIALGVILLLLIAGIIYGLRQSAVRISHIQVFGLPGGEAGADALPAGRQESLADIATRAMQGNYFGIIPRDSAFFFPAARIRADIASANPDIAAVSIFLNGLTSISIKANARVPIARWCGTTPDVIASSSPSLNCYFFDANGFVYATTSVDSTHSTSSGQAGSPQAAQPVNPFIVYGPLASTGETIGSTLPNANKLPSAFDFARQLVTFGSPVSSVVFRADEVDDYLASGTRITYVLGDEQNAFTALVSARAYLKVADGSLEYVDLRFAGETYFKRKK